MSTVTRRVNIRWCVALFATLILVVLSACGEDETEPTSGAAETSGEPYFIGFNDDLSGPIAFAGTALQGGFMTYIEHLNENGGVNGRPIEVKALDNRADGAVALSNYRELARDGTLATVGYSSSVAWSAAGAAADQTEVTQIAISGVDKWTEEEHPYLFKAGQTQDVAMNIQMQYADGLVEEMSLDGPPRVGIFTITTASGPVFEEAARASAVERGWPVVGVQAVDPGASDCSAQAAKLASANPDIIVSNLESVGEDVTCFKAMKSRGYDGPFVNSFYSAHENTLKVLESPDWHAERVFVWPTDKTVPAAVEMYARAQKYGHADKIGDFFSDGYVIGMLVEQALKDCGAECTPETFRDALEGIGKIDTGGLTGPNFGFTTGPNGHMAAPEGKMYVWSDEEGQAVQASDGWICGLSGRC